MTDEVYGCIHRGSSISDCKSAFLAWDRHRLATSKRNHSQHNRGIASRRRGLQVSHGQHFAPKNINEVRVCRLSEPACSSL